jgi:quinol monooxygenase YgiN
MPEQVHVVAHIHALPEKIDAVRSVLEGLLAPTRQEAGCIEYDFYEDADDPSKFTFIETWSSREALDAHLKTPHLEAGAAALQGRLAEEIWIQVLRAK